MRLLGIFSRRAVGGVVGLLLSLLSAHGAVADEWSFQQQGGAFGAPVSLAAIMSDDMRYAFLLRCQGRQEPMYAMLATSEVYRNPIASARLLVRVDDGEVYATRAIAEGAPIQLRYTAPLAALLFVDLGNAQRRISVAIQMGDQIVHERDFPVTNFKTVYQRLKDACWF